MRHKHDRNYPGAILKLFALLPVILLSTACTQAIKLNEIQTHNVYDFEIIDSIPAEDKTLDIGELSFTGTECGYGIRRLDDKSIAPHDRVSYLKDLLQGNSNGALANKHIDIKRFTMHFNMQLYIRDDLNEGLIANIMQDGACVPDSTFPGGYDIEESDGVSPMYVFVIEYTVDNQPFKSRVVESAKYTPEETTFFGDPEGKSNKAFNKAFIKLADDMISKIEASE